MFRRFLFLVVGFLASANLFAQTVTITESAGWLESAYVKWQPVAGATSYNVYYTGGGFTNKKIDSPLIRSYGTYFRADVLGLKAGLYTLRVNPVVAGAEVAGAVTGSLTVEAHDRTGFCFANGRVPGAYKADGTPKDNAVILYITQNTKDKVSMDVTSANANPCVGLQAILDGFKKGKDARPLIVRLIGQITDLTYMLGGDIVIENANFATGYITMEGVGNDAVADGWGIRVKNASNIEIRNIGTMNCNSDEGDNIGLQQDNDYIWVHNCDYFYGNAGSDADQIKGDGALDCKKSTYVTFSYNHFWDSGKCNLLGLSEGTTAGLFISYHHNWYDHSDSRHPRVRFYSAHVYNNYYDGNAKYGVGSTMGSSVFVEANYFRNCKYPILTSMQGSDVYNETTQANDYANMPIFSSEDGGTIKAFNNYIIGQKRFVPYGTAGYPKPTVDFDAVVVANRADTIGKSIVSYQGANTYNNFDTNASVMYAYTPDSPEAARTKVMAYAGRVLGGDLKWTFNNAVDDASYAVNAELKAALTNYKTTLVSVQGDSAVVKDTTGTGGGTGTDTTHVQTSVVHNFTTAGKTSTYFTITGNLSTSKGTVTYQGLTLTQCLKIESTTIISFTTTQPTVLILVFNPEFVGKISINGVACTAVAGIVTQNLAAGAIQILKTDAANLFYMALSTPTALENTQTVKSMFFPNPVKSTLSVTSGATILKAEIYNLAGELVQKTETHAKTIDMSRLNKGKYLVKAYTDEGLVQQIILK
jgi:pectate lyase